MPGTGTYTQDEVDALLATIRTEQNLKATRAEVASLGQLHNNSLQANTNDLTQKTIDVRNLQSDVADLMRRVLAVHTHSATWHKQSPVLGTHRLHFAHDAVTVSDIHLYIDAGSTSLNIALNDTGDMFTTDVTGIANTWVTMTPNANAGLATGDWFSLTLDSAAGVTDMNIQVDYTVD